MKRIHLRSFLLVAFIFGASLGLAFAQVPALPDDAQFDAPVEFTTGDEGESLRFMLAALARSVGLTPIVDRVPDTTIVYNIDDPKPFRQVWDLVLTLQNLDYVLLENDVVVVGTSGEIAALRDAPDPSAAAQEPTAETLRRFYRVNNDPGQVVTILRQSIPGISADALAGVNAIVVFGTQEQQDEVQRVLGEFDQAADEAAAEPLEQRIYFLSNARAGELAGVLSGADIVVSGEGGSGGEAASFSVTADDRTNSVIVTATAPVQAQLAEIIPQLDRPQQQVNVQVRIQEVTRRTARNLGLSLDNLSFGNLAASILDTGLSFIFDSTAVSSLNVVATLNALESQGLSRRVDDSTITVLNNETGSLQSGGRIEINFPSNDGGVSQRTIEFGVLVDVTPRISNDGRVILDVNAEVSDLAVPLSEGGIPERIDFNERAVTSTVTLAPGQTVLLGGLLQNSFTSSEQRVPVLGAIPLLGDLFGRTIEEDESGELILVVSAEVLD